MEEGLETFGGLVMLCADKDVKMFVEGKIYEKTKQPVIQYVHLVEKEKKIHLT